ncbi:MAG: hypothetical protein EA409_03190 [Saprospirales bacterium]|nr:MAG: hypothetical protein EA409_03190 [Saprospirales bacterium]
MGKQLLVIGVLLILFFVFACSTEEPKAKETVNTGTMFPNDDSELALLMRFMYDDMERVKKEIENGGKASIEFDPEEMFTAEPTDSAQVSTEHYKAFGKSFIAAYNAFQNANTKDLARQYSVLVQSCMTCHQSVCPGPMRRIENLYLASN